MCRFNIPGVGGGGPKNLKRKKVGLHTRVTYFWYKKHILINFRNLLPPPENNKKKIFFKFVPPLL